MWIVDIKESQQDEIRQNSVLKAGVPSTGTPCYLPVLHVVSLSKDLSTLLTVEQQRAALPAYLICSGVWWLLGSHASLTGAFKPWRSQSEPTSSMGLLSGWDSATWKTPSIKSLLLPSASVSIVPLCSLLLLPQNQSQAIWFHFNMGGNTATLA